jgi:hypothetical protein
MKHQNIQVISVSDPTGTTAPSAGANGLLGRLALQSDLKVVQDSYIKKINTVSPTSNEMTFVSDGTLEVVPQGNGTILLRVYTAMSANLDVSPTLVEQGATITGADLSWTLNKTETSQQLNNGIGAVTTGVRSYNHVDTITSTRTYTISASDGTTTDTDSATITFGLKNYWGTTILLSDLNEANVEAAENSAVATSRANSYTVNPSGNHVFFAYPTSYGLATVKDGNNNTFADWANGGVQSTSPYTVLVTNTYGVSANYYVYHTYNNYNGSVTFIWS